VPVDLADWGGPVIAALLAVIGVLWKDHLRATADDRRQRDEWRVFALDIRDKWGEQIAATKELAAAVHERNRRDLQTRRRDDE